MNVKKDNKKKLNVIESLMYNHNQQCYMYHYRNKDSWRVKMWIKQKKEWKNRRKEKRK